MSTKLVRKPKKYQKAVKKHIWHRHLYTFYLEGVLRNWENHFSEVEHYH